jgi:hypothetical protein
MFIKTQTLPKVLSFSETKYYIFSVTFTAAAVFFPWLAHQFGLAGQIYLPMQFFILIAGLLYGWRTGLIVGLISPFLSFSLTQMPNLTLLPQVIIELAVYGLIIGIFREKKINIWTSLLSAMILGRLARVLFILAFVPKMAALQFIQISLPGIILQIILVPFGVYLFQKFISDKSNA